MTTKKRLVLAMPALCKAFGIASNTAYRWLSAGRVQVVRIGGRLFIDPAEIERITTEGTRAPTSTSAAAGQ